MAEYQEKRISEPEFREELRQTRQELDMFRKQPGRNCSAYFVMRKITEQEKNTS